VTQEAGKVRRGPCDGKPTKVGSYVTGNYRERAVTMFNLSAINRSVRERIGK